MTGPGREHHAGGVVPVSWPSGPSSELG
jgi:hypothetical protein